MTNPRRALRIPDALAAALQRKGHRPLWYTGSLQAENGRDVGMTPLAAEEIARDAPLTVRRVKRTGAHPGKALADD